jgi:hypothetical protein
LPRPRLAPQTSAFLPLMPRSTSRVRPPRPKGL